VVGGSLRGRSSGPAVGVCYIVTGAALRPAAWAGRLVLIADAAAGMLVAANPEPAAGGGTVSHATWAALGFTGLASWPVVAWRRGSPVPWGLRPAVCFGAIAVELLLLAWFVAELVAGGRAGRPGGAGRRAGAGALAACGSAVLPGPARPDTSRKGFCRRAGNPQAGCRTLTSVA